MIEQREMMENNGIVGPNGVGSVLAEERPRNGLVVIGKEEWALDEFLLREVVHDRCSGCDSTSVSGKPFKTVSGSSAYRQIDLI